VPELARNTFETPSRALFLFLALLAFVCVLSAAGTDLLPPVAPLFVLLLVVQLLAVRSPRAAFFVLVANAIFFPVLPVTKARGTNPIDMLIGPALLGSWLWFRPRGKRVDRFLKSEIERSRLVAAALTFYGVAVLSLVAFAISGHPLEAGDSALLLSRSMEASLYFVLATRLLRTEKDLHAVCWAMFAGFLMSVVSNASLFEPRTGFDVPRAGAVLVFASPKWYTANPNEEAAACLILWAAALAFPLKRWVRILAMLAVSGLLIASQSRSGLLAGAVFVAMLGLQKQWRFLWLLPFAFLAVFPFLPKEWILRVTRTLVLERGSFEAYSSLVRFFTWEASFNTFLAHPILGVGYLCYRWVSSAYNPLAAVLPTAESMYLETAAGTGICGLFALGWIFVAGFRMSRAIKREAPPDSFAHRLAAITPAYLGAVAAGNITGDNLTGIMCVMQFALFFGMLGQAARIERARAAGLAHA